MGAILSNKGRRKQIGGEVRDPRLYSNLRGMATGESKEDRVKAHKDLGEGGTVVSAMKQGFGRKKQSSVQKVALDVQKMKKNLDDAPDRPQKFPTHGDGYKKAGLDKEAIGLMGAAMGALTIPEHARTAKNNLAATKGMQGAVLTPGQVKQRKAQMGMM